MSSAISGLGTNSSWLQSLQSQSAWSQTASPQTASDAADPTSTHSSNGQAANGQVSGRHHHRRGGGGFGKMDQALEQQGITGDKLTTLQGQIHSALQSAKSDGTDPKSAIDGVLNDAGVDLSAFQQAMGGPNGDTAGTGLGGSVDVTA